MKKVIVIGIIIAAAILVGMSFVQSDSETENDFDLPQDDPIREPKHFSESLTESAGVSTP